MPKTHLRDFRTRNETKQEDASAPTAFFVEIFYLVELHDLLVYETIVNASNAAEAERRVRREFLEQHPRIDESFTVEVRATPYLTFFNTWLKSRCAGLVTVHDLDQRWRDKDSEPLKRETVCVDKA